MSAANASITQRKDRRYVKQAIIEENNNKKSLKEHRSNETAGCHIVQRQFLICQVCFWCASYYTYDAVNWSSKFDVFNLAAIQQCPGCSAKDTIESLPISQNQRYTHNKQT